MHDCFAYTYSLCYNKQKSRNWGENCMKAQGLLFPKDAVTRWGLSSLKFFLTGENLFTFRADKDMKDFDPESSTGRGISAFGAKSVAFGVNVSF